VKKRARSSPRRSLWESQCETLVPRRTAKPAVATGSLGAGAAKGTGTRTPAASKGLARATAQPPGPGRDDVTT
jgi:hypothetical protein